MRQLGQIPKAIDSFKVASNLDPSNAEVQQYLRELIDAIDGQWGSSAPGVEGIRNTLTCNCQNRWPLDELID